MKKKIALLLCFCSLAVLFLLFRNLAVQESQKRVNVGMSLIEVVESLQTGTIVPYSCAWRIVGDKKPTATKGCNLPTEKFLSRAGSGYSVMIIFKGVGIDYDFEIEFDENGKVKLISDGSAR